MLQMLISKGKIVEEVVNSFISYYLVNSNIDYSKIFHDGNWEYNIIWYTMSIQKTLDTKGFYVTLRRSLLNGGTMKYETPIFQAFVLFYKYISSDFSLSNNKNLVIIKCSLVV